MLYIYQYRERETIFTCPHTLKFMTRPLAGTASGMASDSVRGRGYQYNSRNMCYTFISIIQEGVLYIYQYNTGMCVIHISV